ncbi:hypothetical protein ACFV4Q_36350 [Streptomyces nojiriensis]|uniref:hypothetical protein n=1 Tax=Streptomyces nojiriensis TaxID=66374 RepID=UPI003646E151
MAISDRPSLGLLNAVFGKAHTAALRGDHTTARRMLAEGRRIFDRADSHEQTSDSAVPWWRVNVFVSLLAVRLGDETTAVAAQDAATTELPASLPRFATQLEMHHGPMLARSGDVAAGTAHAHAALDALPPEKYSRRACRWSSSSRTWGWRSRSPSTWPHAGGPDRPPGALRGVRGRLRGPEVAAGRRRNADAPQPRRAARRILPLSVFGSAVTKWTRRG